jgi:hypothetical protein
MRSDSPAQVSRPRPFTAARGLSGGDPGRGLTALVVTCVALAGASLLLPAGLTYDPWAWLVWGRNVADLDLRVGTAPSWKPLPVLFTTVFSFAGEAAPALWLVVSRAGALLAVAMAARLAARWCGGGLRLLAGCTAAAGLLLVHEYLRRAAVGNVEPLMVGVGLLAIERHLDGHRRQALALGVMAGLVRPEIWPFLGAYGVQLWFADRRARALIVAAISLIPLLWFGGALWGSGDALQASHVVLAPGRPTAGALTQHHGLRAFSEFAAMPPLPVVLLAVLGVALSVKPRSPALGPVAIAAGAAAAWVTILAIMVERGFTVIPRYLFMPAALAAILAGVGMARAISLAAGTGRRLPDSPPRSPRLAPAVVIAIAAAAALSVSEFRLLRDDWRAVTGQAERDRDLAAAVALAGGARAVRACGSIVTVWFEKSALAWELGADLPDVSQRARPGPTVTFAYRSPGATARVPAGAQVFENDSWQVVADCRDGRLIGPGPSAAGSASTR